jgi:hypothetical protein
MQNVDSPLIGQVGCQLAVVCSSVSQFAGCHRRLVSRQQDNGEAPLAV